MVKKEKNSFLDYLYNYEYFHYIFCVGFMVSEIPRVSVFGHCPYSVTFSYKDFAKQNDMIVKS